jgi:OmpA-OmpF porin, OOP family
MKTIPLFSAFLLILSCTPLLAQDEQQTTTTSEKLSATSKYDFITGETVVFFDDFNQENIGDFPASWNTDGSGEIVTTNLFPGRWFKLGASGSFVPEIKKAFPDNFTVEFDIIPIPGAAGEQTLTFDFDIYSATNPADLKEGGAIPGVAGIKMSFGSYQHGYSNYADGSYILNNFSEKNPLELNKKTRLSFWIQKQRIRAYINEYKVFDIPRALPPNYIYNVIRFISGSEAVPMIANFRVAVGAPDMRNKLLTEGKLITYGIYFDSGSDKVKPESAGTMKEIAAVLAENPTVRIQIVGHTDSDGDDAKNLDLSKRRAASVKNALSTEYGIEASRLETDGKGETQPLAPNATSEGKAKNRRVELIKL